MKIPRASFDNRKTARRSWAPPYMNGQARSDPLPMLGAAPRILRSSGGPRRGRSAGLPPGDDYISQEELPAALQLPGFKGLALNEAEEFRLLPATKRLEAWYPARVGGWGRGRGLEDPQTLQGLRGEVSPSQSGGTLFSSCPPRSGTLWLTPGNPCQPPPQRPTFLSSSPLQGEGRESPGPAGRKDVRRR